MDKRTRILKKSMLLAKILYGCHQMPERSFFIHGYQFPLCARCTGIMVGYLLSLLLCVLQIVFPFWLSILMLIPLIADGLFQLAFCIMSNNIRRLITGLLFGSGIICITVNIVSYLMSF